VTEPLLRAESLRKRFGEVEALRGVSFEAAGEIHILAGENGAGKTTLVNILSGLYRADAGEIFFDGLIPELTDRIVPSRRRQAAPRAAVADRPRETRRRGESG
jgi:ABC-type sugar transport system ATPase subunit